MVKICEAEAYLKNKIANFCLDTIDIKKIWEIFKSFGREPVEGEDEIALRFECGVYNFTGEEIFYFNFVRQFAIYVDNKYSHLEHLYCSLEFKPTEELRKLETCKYYFNYDGDINDFYRKIECLQEFKIPLTKKPIRFSVYQEEV